MMYFKAFDENKNIVTVTEYPGTETAQIVGDGIFGAIWGYRVDTSTYVGTNGIVYSNSESKLKANNNSRTIEWAFLMMRRNGLME